MWQLKEYAQGAHKKENALKMQAMLQDCAGIVPGLKKLEVSLVQEGLEATYDIVLYSEFDSKESLESYKVHHKHAALKPFVQAVAQARQCMDFIV